LRGLNRFSLWILVSLAGLLIVSCQVQISYPAPVIKSLSQTSIEAGQPAFVLTVNGSNLTPVSIVEWNGTARSTIFVSSSELTAQILASDIQNAGTALVTIFTTSPGGGTSQSLTFTITPAPSPIPQISQLSPSGVSTGSGGFTLNVQGSNFVSESVVTANSAPRLTGYLNSTQLQAQILASDVANGGTVQIAVTNPQPGGGSSNSFALTVTNPIPKISAVSPTAVQAGSTSTTLTVNGSQFVPNSVVLLNGAQRVTSFVNSGQVTILLTQADLAEAGVNQVQVQSPAPGGGPSNIATLAVNPTDEGGLPVLVDLAPDGSQANEGVCGAACSAAPPALTLTTAGPSASATGEFVAYASISSNLLASPTTGTSDIFLRDTCLSASGTGTSSCTPKTTLVNLPASGSAADGPSSQPSLDSGAAHVAYTSTASNLTNYLTVPIPTGTRQVYWQATCLSTTTAGACSAGSGAPVLISVDPTGLIPGDGDSYDPVVSPDGRYVAFVSLATNLVTGLKADGITPQVYIRDTCNLVPPATSSTCTTPTTYLVSTPDGTTFGDHASTSPAIANNGLYVAFSSAATNLDATAANPTAQQEVFVRSTCINVTTGCAPTTTLVSTPDGTTLADGVNIEPAISIDGRFVAFASTATNLVIGIVSGVSPVPQQIYVVDTCTGVTTGCTPFNTVLVSSPDLTTTPINGANANSNNPSISQCSTTTTTTATSCTVGQYIAFSTKASNLGTTANGVENVFVRNTCLGVTASTTTTSTATCVPYIFLGSQPGGTGVSLANGDSIIPAISGDGRAVSFVSSASNLVANDVNGMADVFLAGAAPSFTLTVALSGTGSGTVTDSLAKINCIWTAATTTTSAAQTGTCSAKYLYGDAVTLTATTTSPATFGTWGGSVTTTQCPAPTTSSTTSSCSVTVTSNVFSNITATFNQ